MAYDLPTKDESGDVNAGYYYNQEFDKILKYTEDKRICYSIKIFYCKVFLENYWFSYNLIVKINYE